MQLLGYSDAFSVEPRGTIRFMVSAGVDRYEADIVRLVGGVEQGANGLVPAVRVSTDADGTYTGVRQQIKTGSYGRVEHRAELCFADEFTLQAWLYPTLPARGRAQGLVSKLSPNQGGFALVIESDGVLALWLRDGEGRFACVRARHALRAREWYFVACAYGGQAGRTSLLQAPTSAWLRDEITSTHEAVDVRIGVNEGPLLFGALAEHDDSGRVAGMHFYNGKLENPGAWRRMLTDTELNALAADELRSSVAGADLVAAWDFAAGAGTTQVLDTGPHGLHGRVVNCPTRAVTGHAWTGAEMDFRRAPHQYGAIHFHEDDLEDACWEASIELDVPRDVASGVYAARLRSSESVDHIPFVVRPRLDTAGPPVGVLLPTLTYMAYANVRFDDWKMAMANNVLDGPTRLDPFEAYIQDHPELGLSLYDRHVDGSLCCYSSRLRPIVDMRPQYRYSMTGGIPRHFAADLHLIGWLERRGQSYEVFTDEDLDRDGAELLSRHRVVITGSHPEYCTERMLDALETYVARGGRVMYLGGNGFYWVTSIAPGRPHLAEVRRGHAGTRVGDSGAGEGHHSTTGEPGGLWRFRGRPPQRLVGVGFAAQGCVGGAGYERHPASRDPSVSYVFDGIGDGEIIGDFGPMGGAAADEIDRADADLGTPPQTIVLATSQGRHDDAYQIAIEETPMILPNQGGTSNQDVRSDIVLVEMPGGGAVFAAGSIGWSLALGENDGDNNVARMTENVLSRFAEEARLPLETEVIQRAG